VPQLLMAPLDAEAQLTLPTTVVPMEMDLVMP
jgi:hypothetical protein